MAISRNIVNLMNGNIKVESTLHKGTKITVTIYLELQEKEKEQDRNLMNLPVLVVDDDKTCCESTVATLKEIGITGEWVLSGREAVERCYAHHELKNDYFAVILDWKMPDMDGLDTAREIRRRVGPDLPIIMLSGYDCSDVGADFLAAGVDVFIMKPLFKSNMVHLLRNFAEDRGCGHASAVPRPEGQRLDGLHVLLVEDNEINMEIARTLLEFRNASVDGACNGQQAVEMFRSSPQNHYDAVLMDVRMPVMDGIAATQAIRGLDRADAATVPILAMTANAFHEDVVSALSAGMNSHISKPIDPECLYQVLIASLRDQAKPAGA